MNTKEVGNYGEDVACKFLESKGFKIIDRNWKTKMCEIDIICSKNSVIYFVEVKYRRTDKYGDGLDAITAKKLKQMHFSAEMWVANNKLQGDYALAIVPVSENSIDLIEI